MHSGLDWNSIVDNSGWRLWLRPHFAEQISTKVLQEIPCLQTTEADGGHSSHRACNRRRWSLDSPVHRETDAEQPSNVDREKGAYKPIIPHIVARYKLNGLETDGVRLLIESRGTKPSFVEIFGNVLSCRNQWVSTNHVTDTLNWTTGIAGLLNSAVVEDGGKLKNRTSAIIGNFYNRFWQVDGKASFEKMMHTKNSSEVCRAVRCAAHRGESCFIGEPMPKRDNGNEFSNLKVNISGSLGSFIRSSQGSC